MKKRSDKHSDAPPRVAIFSGDDSIGREKAKSEIVGAVYASAGDVVEERFDPSAEGFDEFAARIITPSLFQDTRIFHIRHANQLSEQERKELARIIRYDLPDAYIIIEIDENLRGKAKAGTYLESLGIKPRSRKADPRIAVRTFDRPADYKIPAWLTTQVPLLFDRSIARPDAEFLVECVGTELDTLYSELQKIDIHLPPNAPVDRPAIESICGATRTQSPFELARALGNRNYPRALEILDSLFASTFYAPACLSVIFRHFWGLFRIRAYAKAHPDTVKRYLNARHSYEARNELAHEIGVAAGMLQPDDPAKKAYPVIILSRAVEQARSFTDDQLTEIFGWLRRFDVDIKTGRADADKCALQLLCYKIVRIGQYEHAGGI
ncbi:MAG: hypothetical protein GF418_10115 [Chitinivibrionales bacterium]|nr:hypothetical protein [Chitinivibrionales bacterium]MBD3395967.1 hypothetical protein [Chitinivibrionales bacterium]